MNDFETRVASLLRDMTDSIHVATPLDPPTPKPRPDRTRLVAACVAAVLFVGAGVGLWWSASGDDDVLRSADSAQTADATQPDGPDRAEPLVPTTSVLVETDSGQVAVQPAPGEVAVPVGEEPPLPLQYWAIIDPSLEETYATLVDVGFENRTTSADYTDVIDGADELIEADLLVGVVVVHLGTDEPLDPAQLDALIAALSTVRNVVLVTPHGTAPPTQENADLLHSLDQPDDNITVFDWASEIMECPGSCLAADGVSLLEDGQQFFRDRLGSVIGFEPPRTEQIDPASRPVVAITTDGDAVVIPVDGTTPTVLYDGPPSGNHQIDHVAASLDESIAFVALCCEPISGELITINLGDEPASDEGPTPGPKFAGVVAMSPRQDGIAYVLPDRIIAGGLGANDEFNITLPTAMGKPYDLAWFDLSSIDNPTTPYPNLKGQLVALTRNASGVQLITMTDIATTATADHAVTIDPDTGADITLAGTTADGLVLVHDGRTPGEMAAFDPVTLEAAGTVQLPDDALRAWQDGDKLTWIDTTNTLYIDETQVDGSYRWTRR